MNNETNDQRILLLKQQIEAKKEKLNKSTRFSPITNCSIEVDGIRHNLQVLPRAELIALMVKLNAYKISAINLSVENEYSISGFKLDEWITDIKSKISILSQKDEEKSLKMMEDKLLKMLSDGKKVELELNEIEAMIK